MILGSDVAVELRDLAKGGTVEHGRAEQFIRGIEEREVRMGLNWFHV